MGIVSSSRTFPGDVSRTRAFGCAAVVQTPSLTAPDFDMSRFTAASRLAFVTPPIARNGYQYIENQRVS